MPKKREGSSTAVVVRGLNGDISSGDGYRKSSEEEQLHRSNEVTLEQNVGARLRKEDESSNEKIEKILKRRTKMAKILLKLNDTQKDKLDQQICNAFIQKWGRLKLGSVVEGLFATNDLMTLFEQVSVMYQQLVAYQDLLSKRADLKRQEEQKQEEREALEESIKGFKDAEMFAEFSTYRYFSEELHKAVDGVIDQLRERYNRHCSGREKKYESIESFIAFLQKIKESSSSNDKVETKSRQHRPFFQRGLETDREARNLCIRRAGEVYEVWGRWQGCFDSVACLPVKLEFSKIKYHDRHTEFDNSSIVVSLCWVYQNQIVQDDDQWDGVRSRKKRLQEALRKVKQQEKDLNVQQEAVRTQLYAILSALDEQPSPSTDEVESERLRMTAGC